MALTVTNKADALGILKAVAENEAAPEADFMGSAILDSLDEALDARCPMCLGKITLLTLATVGLCGDCDDKRTRSFTDAGTLADLIGECLRALGVDAYSDFDEAQIREEGVYEVKCTLGEARGFYIHVSQAWEGPEE